MKLTGWFPATTHPKRNGLYQVHWFPEIQFWAVWKDGTWFYEDGWAISSQQIKWRGLAENPNAK